MKNTIWLMPLLLLVIAWGCEQEPDERYDGRDRIYFEYDYPVYNGRVSFDSVIYSFGRKADSVLMDTAKVVVRFLGTASSKEREYRVTIVSDSTTAVAGVHYQPVSETQIFRDSSLTDTLRVVVLRENLNSSHIAKERKKIYFRLEPSKDFDLGLEQGVNMKLSLNNFLSEPRWWKTYAHFFDFYHPEKWKILMEFDKGFADSEKLSFDGNTMNMYANALAGYLRDNVVKDKETGERVYMDRLVGE